MLPVSATSRNGHEAVARHAISVDAGLGIKYEGTAPDDLEQCQGVLTYASGEKKNYTGECKRNPDGTYVPHGTGTLTYSAIPVERAFGRSTDTCFKYMYVGHFTNGRFSGPGQMTYVNYLNRITAKYDGEWVDGLRYGRGSMMYLDHLDYPSHQYDGEWVNDMGHGRGTFTQVSSSAKGLEAHMTARVYVRYIGAFSYNQFHGGGKWTFYDKYGIAECQYEGAFQNGKRLGQGTLTSFKYEIQYEGNWGATDAFGKPWGVPHGQGTLTFKNQDRYEGNWERGKPSGVGTEIRLDGSRYEGEWNRGKRCCGTRISLGGLEEKDRYNIDWNHGKYLGKPPTDESCVIS